ncbi:hypothetical protein FNAPI_8667 [Fusarium napiforme]|uniref:Uncharacterized protein n=1 Tax=Fusarium napiforme TaxID=42672 RepID=A0A8H5J2D0_9HYPO|nr:hypothetical protein FNAPI_8667 [Fusarium napiforme]
MGSMAPDVSLQTLAAADGLLAGLIYLSTTEQATAESRITKPFVPHNLQSWKHLEVVWINLENVRQRLRALVLTQSLEGIDVAPDSFVDPFVFFQAAISSLRNTLIGQPPSTLIDVLALYCPCGSALVTNLKLFLDQCGDLFQVLSGRWVTAKHQYSPSSAILDQAKLQCNDVISCIQRMRQGESFQDPFSLGILAIVDLFIQLGYLKTPEDIQEYMIIVGKEIMPDREFVKYCALVVNAVGTAVPSGHRSLSMQPVAAPEPYVK